LTKRLFLLKIRGVIGAHREELKVKQYLVHEIDLIELDGEGDFLCPVCGTKISPDDETEEVYSVLEAKVRDNTLESLLIRCNTCSNKILLTGFSALET
jgi:DNA-directed RNA polymerase subunit RPC12/RpoP